MNEITEKYYDNVAQETDIQYGWESDFKKPWENVKEVNGAYVIEGEVVATKKRRQNVDLQNTIPMKRGLLRYVTLVVDCTTAMLEMDFKPDRIRCVNIHLQKFVNDFFQLNPLSHMNLILLHDGGTKVVSHFTCHPSTLIEVIKEELVMDKCSGYPSLQLALQRVENIFDDVEKFYSKEVIFFWGSLRTLDASDIFETLDSIAGKKIKISFILFSPEMNVLRTIATKTNGEIYMCMNEQSFISNLQPLLLAPIKLQDRDASVPTPLLYIGIPSYKSSNSESLCACHQKIVSEGYICPCCLCTVCYLPTRCNGCGIFLVRANDISVAYKHLFSSLPFLPCASKKFLKIVPSLERLDEDFKKDVMAKKFSDDKFSFALQCVSCEHEVTNFNDLSVCLSCCGIFCEACDEYIQETLSVCPNCAKDS